MRKDIYSNKLKIWYEKHLQKISRSEVGISYFKKVLFWSSKDKDGLWIDKTVAEIKNSNETIRNGYKKENF